MKGAPYRMIVHVHVWLCSWPVASGSPKTFDRMSRFPGSQVAAPGPAEVATAMAAADARAAAARARATRSKRQVDPASAPAASTTLPAIQAKDDAATTETVDPAPAAEAAEAAGAAAEDKTETGISPAAPAVSDAEAADAK